MKILSVGATGEFASMVIPELKERGATVRALVRDDSKTAKAREQGADETVVGDLEDPASLRKAVEGVDGIFHIGPGFAPNEAQMGINIVGAAKAARVPKFVFSGVIHPSLSKMVNHSAKRPVEEALYESGLTSTILQPTMFMQNMTAAWPQILKSGRIALPYSKDVKACYVDYRDVAEAAAIALTSDKLDNGAFELCAPGEFTRVELAAMISEAAGRPIEAGVIPFDEYAKQAHLPEGPLKEGLGTMYADYDQYGFRGGNALVLTAVLGHAPRTLQQFFRELAGQS
jgi:uncharacterized protein YbjT (DUF2867 family)